MAFQHYESIALTKEMSVDTNKPMNGDEPHKDPKLVAARAKRRAAEMEKAETVPTANLKLIVIGQGQTAGRTPSLIRIRPHILKELRQHADGQMYLLIEIALQRLTAELAARAPGTPVEVVRAEDMV